MPALRPRDYAKTSLAPEWIGETIAHAEAMRLAWDEEHENGSRRGGRPPPRLTSTGASSRPVGGRLRAGGDGAVFIRGSFRGRPAAYPRP